jgi:hypothetical protein
MRGPFACVLVLLVGVLCGGCARSGEPPGGPTPALDPWPFVLITVNTVGGLVEEYGRAAQERDDLVGCATGLGAAEVLDVAHGVLAQVGAPLPVLPGLSWDPVGACGLQLPELVDAAAWKARIASWHERLADDVCAFAAILPPVVEDRALAVLDYLDGFGVGLTAFLGGHGAGLDVPSVAFGRGRSCAIRTPSAFAPGAS